ncbi:hypothetical protein B0T17DRAFT_616764 [Bombardia bombarda]|uniref:Uncharacterized protein n=1 Tax=Bombardia bombarda TaxID=252184 RepID=A0AA39WZK8_9PEZI|nr:hypothetical protein B0T17DRAFT_616764 [Bombardia bombarda]
MTATANIYQLLFNGNSSAYPTISLRSVFTTTRIAPGMPALVRLLNLDLNTDPQSATQQLLGLNMALHCAHGAAAGIVRAVMRYNGLRGGIADLVLIATMRLLSARNWQQMVERVWSWGWVSEAGAQMGWYVSALKDFWASPEYQDPVVGELMREYAALTLRK